MSHEILTTVTLALVTLNGLALIAGRVGIMRDVHELARLARDVADLVIQEEPKTRAGIRAASAHR